ncbi:MAG: rod shape-determining protein MreC [Nitrospirae bacterium]|nr:rod shape-determining protein MreC [Nitrospirota bacterium]MBI3594768.1 rod shape-determining protein MreC [Nitrospirota bacterium]
MSIFRFSRSDRFIKRIILAVSLIMVLAIAVTLDLSKSPPSKIQNPVLFLGYWAEASIHSLVGGMTHIWANYIDIVQTREKYAQLQKDFDVLKGENNYLKETQFENERLRKLLEIPLPPPLKLTVAEVILREPSNWYKSLTINKGSQDGLEPGMGVMTSAGVVGRILKVGSKNSIVQLITDRNSAVAALISRTRDQGILEGTLRGLTRVKYLSVDLKLTVGDQVETSGLTPTFPKGILIGSVIKVDQKSESEGKKTTELMTGDPFLSVEVVPAVNFSRLEEVMVIRSSPAADAELVGIQKK